MPRGRRPLSQLTILALPLYSHVSFPPQWFSWPEVFGLYHEGAGAFIISYFFFIVWACLFGLLAVLLVRVFAPYASGSGIPEVSRRQPRMTLTPLTVTDGAL